MFRRVLVLLRPRVAVVGAAFLILAGSAFAVSGAAPRSSKTYYACVVPGFGTLNLTTRSAACPSGQRKISFNARGQRGARGRAGAAGATGAAGPAGDRGPSVFGSPGSKGEKGDTGEKGDKGDTGATGAQGAVGPTGPSGASFVRITNQAFVSIPNVGGLTFSCFNASQYGLQFTSTPAGGAGVTSIWRDDSLAGLTYETLNGINVLTWLNPGTGTRHVTVRAANGAKSGTWDVFIEGSAANGCSASVQTTS